MYETYDNSARAASNSAMWQQLQGSGGIAGIQSNCPPDKAPQIGTQLEILNKEVTAQRDTIERLAIRLEPVMSIAPPQDQMLKGNANTPTCPVANTIADLGASIAANTAIIASLMRRLEV